MHVFMFAGASGGVNADISATGATVTAAACLSRQIKLAETPLEHHRAYTVQDFQEARPTK